MQKVLILSCHTGDGHNSAAKAVAEAFSLRGVEAQIEDPVAFGGEKAQKFVTSFYNNMIRYVPRSFAVLYKAGGLYSSTGITSPIYLANAGYSEKLRQYIVDNGFEAVLCTHLYGMEALTAIRKHAAAKAKKEEGLPDGVRTYGIMTDYTCIPFLAETDLDLYFSPHQALQPELLHAGFPAEKLLPSGIPVGLRFSSPVDKTTAREHLGLPQDRKIFLIMSGGIGGGNVKGLCRGLFESLTSYHDDFLICVLTGRNEALKQELDEKYEGSSSVKALGYTTEINLYFNAADVLLSKPGGLSSTEAAVAGIPLVHINAIPGCETSNARFFESQGMSINAGSNAEAVIAAERLAYEPGEAEKMLKAQRQTIHPNAATEIADTVIKEGQK